MFLQIVKTEWRNLFAEKSFLILAFTFAVLIGYGIYNAASWIDEREQRTTALAEKQENDLADKKAKTARGYKGSTTPGAYEPDPSHPYTIGMDLYTAIQPFAPSAIFSLGQSDVLSPEAGVTVSTLQRTKADKTGFENPLSFLAGRFDLSFVVIYLLPLFVLALSFNLLAGEREQGILQLILSQPLELKNFVAAKMTAQFVLIFALVILVSLGGVMIAVRSEMSGDFFIRALLWLVLILAYTLFWFALAAFINSFGYSSATNAVIASASWLVLVLILPALLNIVIASVYPMPSRAETIAAIRSVSLDMRKDGKRLLSEHYQDHPELMPKEGEKAFEDLGLAFVYIQQEQKKKLAEVEGRFAEQIALQQSLVTSLQYLSPSIIALEASNDIAGTGLARHADFRAQVKDFDRAWSDFFVPRIYRMQDLTAADFDSIPRFAFREESTMEVLGRTAPGIVFVLLLSSVLLIATFVRLKNYKLES